MRRMWDSNAAIYLLRGQLASPLPTGSWNVSVITELELLSSSSLNETEEQAIRALLSRVQIVGLEDEVKRTTIELRRKHRLKLPDAIIAATAISLEAELLKNDESLRKTPGLTVRALALRSP